MFSVPMHMHVYMASSFCLFFSKYFNIMSALAIHQPPIMPQIIDSRGGWFGCIKGVVVSAKKMNAHCIKLQCILNLRLFVANHAVFWC